jgi:hypothetical protein
MLSALALASALVYPTMRGRSFDGVVRDAISTVDAMRAAALRSRSERGSWPEPTAPGEVPVELRGALPPGDALMRAGYTLQWSRWNVLEEMEAPPSDDPPPADEAPSSAEPILVDVVRDIGAISLHSADDALLAELLGHYGSEISFVRDSTWTLVVVDGG